VLPDHQQKIDLHQEYPCPCHRQGRLQEITLTEAFGCDRCQKIFVLQEQGHRIEELSTIYPYKSCYFWDGRRWKSVKSSSRDLVWTMLTFAFVFGDRVFSRIFWIESHPPSIINLDRYPHSYCHHRLADGPKLVSPYLWNTRVKTPS
jgi:hypothetical protein